MPVTAVHLQRDIYAAVVSFDIYTAVTAPHWLIVGLMDKLTGHIMMTFLVIGLDLQPYTLQLL